MPLILKAEIYEEGRAPAARSWRSTPRRKPARMSMATKAGRLRTASSAPSFPRWPISSPASALRCCWSRSASCSAASGIGARACFGAWPAFAVFTLAPGLGLPPELPAMPAAELGARQLWWIATAVATALALGLLFYRRSPFAAVAAVALLVVPHLIGAPQPASHESPDPRRPASQFRRGRGADHAPVLVAARRACRAVPGTFHPRQLMARS